MRNKRIMLGIFLSSLLSPLCAQELSISEIGKPEAFRVLPTTYQLDSDHSQINFTVNHLGVSMYSGLIGHLVGRASLYPDNLSASSVVVEIPVDSLMSTNKAIDTYLKTEAFFDVGHYPIAQFRSKTVVPSEYGKAKIIGELTLRGITKPIELTATFTGAGHNPVNGLLTVGFEATTIVKRSEFGIVKSIPFVADDVQVRISAAFEKDN